MSRRAVHWRLVQPRQKLKLGSLRLRRKELSFSLRGSPFKLLNGANGNYPMNLVPTASLVSTRGECAGNDGPLELRKIGWGTTVDQ